MRRRTKRAADDLDRPVALASINPSPNNTLLYRPISSDDPSIRDLAIDIKRNGILEPLVITKDKFILSGHRRYVAARLILPVFWDRAARGCVAVLNSRRGQAPRR